MARLLLGTLLVLLAASAATAAASEAPALLRGTSGVGDDKQEDDVNKAQRGGDNAGGGSNDYGKGFRRQLDVDVKVRGGGGHVDYPGGQANWGNGGKDVDVNVGGGGSGGGSVTAPGGVQVNWGPGGGNPDPQQTPPPTDPPAAPAAPPAPPAPPAGPSADGGASGGSVTAPGVNVTWGNGGANVTQSPAAGTSTGGSVVAPGVNVTWGDGGADADVTKKYPPPRSAGTQAQLNTTVTLDARGSFRDTDGNCHWDWDDFVGSVYIDTVTTFKDHDSETVTVRMRGRTGSCDDARAPEYMGSFQILIEYGQSGWMRTAQTRFGDTKHDGGLSAYNFQYVTAFTGLPNYDPGYDCGKATVTVYDDICN